MGIIEHKICARAGLIGNPSDGYGGKTISVPVRNFHAIVWLNEKRDKIIIPHDANEFNSIEHLAEYTSKEGFYDAGRLVKAAIASFRDYLKSEDIKPNGKKFEIGLETNIPRMVGLAGSSAIITGTMKCLADFYEIEIKPEILANYVLAAERDKLGISAGLQDRVVQAFDNLVYMDFSKKAFKQNNNQFGNYEVLDVHKLPNLFLLYHSNPSESGKVHSDIKSRYHSKNPSISRPIKKAMKEFAGLTDKFKEALDGKDHEECMRLQNRNFNLRRKICGDDALGKENLEMIEIPREVGCSSKFSGSGGAIVGIFPNESYFQELLKRIEGRPYQLERIIF